MIPQNIDEAAVLAAINQINDEGVPASRQSRTYYIKYEDRLYPPKYVVSLANKMVNGCELPAYEFHGGEETNSFLSALGFTIVDGSEVKAPYYEKDVSIVTVTLQCGQSFAPDNKYRMELLKNTLQEFGNSGIILFPAGFFSYRSLRLSKLDKMVNTVKSVLAEKPSNVVICLGVDSDNGKDQLAFAIDQSGVLAVARKFYPTSDEAGCIRTAERFDGTELGHERFFEKYGKRFYLAVCYDGFGIRHQNLTNPGVDVVLVLAHRFYPRGEGPSGEVDFARKGFAGASMQWNCPVFGTAVFFNRDIPESWPTGVVWKSNGQSVKNFKYTDNLLHWDNRQIINAEKEKALCYQYHV